MSACATAWKMPLPAFPDSVGLARPPGAPHSFGHNRRMRQDPPTAKIIGTAPVTSPMRRYYAWQAEGGLNVLYVEDVVTAVRYSVECTPDDFHQMREWSDSRWNDWLEQALRTWLNR
jgi:hypothetical protein